MSDKGSINNITLPVYKKLKAECSVVRTEDSITALNDDVLTKLKCGDIVCKEDSSGKHSYIVSFKKDKVGICLTYADGSGYIETVSYDWNGTTNHWVYNSTDVFNGGEIPNVEEAQSGTINKVLGLNSSGKLVKGNISVGTKIYEHKLNGTATTYDNESIEFSNLLIYSTDNTQITTTALLASIIASAISIAPKPASIICDGNMSFLVSYSSFTGIITYNLDATPVVLKSYGPLQSMGTIVDTVTPL